MMMSVVASAAFFTAAQALAFDGKPPRATDAVVPDATFHLPEVTKGPSVKELMKRQNVQTVLLAPDNTCGYYEGQYGEPHWILTSVRVELMVGTTDAAYTCPSGNTCAFITSSTAGGTGALACCDEDDGCSSQATCLDYWDIFSSSACDDACLRGTFTAKCTYTDYPYCGTATFFDGIIDYYCDSISVTGVQQYYTTYDDEDDGRMLTPLAITVDASGTASDSSSPTGGLGSGSNGDNNDTDIAGNGSSSSGNSSSSNSTDSTPNPSPSSSSSSTNVAAIAGGVVGGVAVLALLAGLGIFFLLRHQKQKRRQQQRNTLNQPTATAQTARPPPGPSPLAAHPYTPVPQQAFGAAMPQACSPPGHADQKPGAHVAVSPPSTVASPVSAADPTAGAAPWAGGPGAPVHEAGGVPVGERDWNAHHRGEFHELG
ncbi:hypothetical protein F4780DRAFT_789329 [Xylariomycetidae sp. FL0641]|nr:hypothetical protein F4780DRAFT_789329 [Xylariomycetidae sp. FL0641]